MSLQLCLELAGLSAIPESGIAAQGAELGPSDYALDNLLPIPLTFVARAHCHRSTNLSLRHREMRSKNFLFCRSTVSVRNPKYHPATRLPAPSPWISVR